MTITRRQFLLAATATGGLVAVGGVGWWAARERDRIGVRPRPWAGPADPTVFLRVDDDGAVTLLCKHLEMGQGIMTGLATLVAEELDADWSRMRVELAPANREAFLNTYYGRQATVASSGIANSWLQMRRVGAGARVMFVGAAAEAWGVPPEEITIRDGVVRHLGSNRQVGFGALARAAMAQPVPDASRLRLKSPSQWTRIGRDVARVDAASKIAATAVFAADVRRPGMVRAVVARPPRFGATLASVRTEEALRVPGVVEVVPLPAGVAVLAEDTWAALRGRDALVVEWDDSGAETRSSAAIYDEYRSLADRPGVVALERGHVDAALDGAAALLEFECTFPYLAHAPMEPLSCVMERTGTGVDVWAGCQLHTLEQRAVAEVLDLSPQQITIHTVQAGASFGRRANPRTDWVPELARIVRGSRLNRPVQSVWTREDDIRGGCYRPMALHRGTVALDERGAVVGWNHRVVCTSLVLGTPWSYQRARAGVDRASVGGIVESSYAIPSLRVDVHSPETPVPVGFWRSVGDGITGFVMESVMDQLAHRAGRDPLEFRLAHLPDDPRQRAVLERAATAADWGAPLPPGRGRGIASVFDGIYGLRTYVAMVTDVTVDAGRLRVDRIVAAVDCGVAVNPNIVEAQIEGSISFALSTALRNEITLQDGLVDQSNFHDFEPTRLAEMPQVEVHLVPSDLPPSGIGEAGVAPVAPSVANALFAATGTRLWSLPLRFESFA